MVTGGSVPTPGGTPVALSNPQGPCSPQDSNMPQRRSAENRRSNKPIMEKRRRARINNCLNELKTLILDAMKKDPARHSKLEKADILEMTVKHLENMQRQQVALATATDPTVINKFRAGFSECAGEVGRFPGLEPAVRRRLMQHLAACLGSASTAGAEPGPQSPPPATSPGSTAQALQLILPAEANGTATPINAAVTGNNGIFFTGANGAGLQLVPTRLPNGDIALVLPSSRANQAFGQVDPVQPNPQTVIKTTPPTSPSPALSTSSEQATSPMPMLVPIPHRTSSTGSATSSASSSSFVSTSTSPVTFERPMQTHNHNLSQAPHCRDAETSPSSPGCPHSPLSSSSSSYDMKHYIRVYSPEEQKPLALVTKKKYEMEVDEEHPWRPW